MEKSDTRFYYIKGEDQFPHLEEWLADTEFTFAAKAAKQDKTGAYLIKLFKGDAIAAFVRSHNESFINQAVDLCKEKAHA